MQLVDREETLEMKRVDSVFKERIERHMEELAVLEEETKATRRTLPVSVAAARFDLHLVCKHVPSYSCPLPGEGGR